MTSPTYPNTCGADLSIDQRLALKAAAAQLQIRFRDVRRRDHRAVPAFLLRPVRRPRHRRQLPAPARRTVRPSTPSGIGQGGRQVSIDGKPTVLFLCTHNAGRSQMAMGFFTELAGRGGRRLVGRIRTRQRGQPRRGRGDGRTRDRHLPGVPQTVDRRNRASRRCRDHHGLRRRLPSVPRTPIRGMGVADPAGQDVDAVRPIRDDIEAEFASYSPNSKCPSMRDRIATTRLPMRLGADHRSSTKHAVAEGVRRALKAPSNG